MRKKQSHSLATYVQYKLSTIPLITRTSTLRTCTSTCYYTYKYVRTSTNYYLLYYSTTYVLYHACNYYIRCYLRVQAPANYVYKYVHYCRYKYALLPYNIGHKFTVKQY
jgi:hypothetical protein